MIPRRMETRHLRPQRGTHRLQRISKHFALRQNAAQIRDAQPSCGQNSSLRLEFQFP